MEWVSLLKHWITSIISQRLLRYLQMLQRKSFNCFLMLMVDGCIQTLCISLKKSLYYMIRTVFIDISLFRIADECTSSRCPEMTAGPHYTYLWTDSHGSNPVEVFYITGNLILSSVQMNILIHFFSIFLIYSREPRIMNVKMASFLMISRKQFRIFIKDFSVFMLMYIIIILV